MGIGGRCEFDRPRPGTGTQGEAILTLVGESEESWY
jgi:hypothetical protein